MTYSITGLIIIGVLALVALVLVLTDKGLKNPESKPGHD